MTSTKATLLPGQKKLISPAAVALFESYFGQHEAGRHYEIAELAAHFGEFVPDEVRELTSVAALVVDDTGLFTPPWGFLVTLSFRQQTQLVFAIARASIEGALGAHPRAVFGEDASDEVYSLVAADDAPARMAEELRRGPGAPLGEKREEGRRSANDLCYNTGSAFADAMSIFAIAVAKGRDRETALEKLGAKLLALAPALDEIAARLVHDEELSRFFASAHDRATLNAKLIAADENIDAKKLLEDTEGLMHTLGRQFATACVLIEEAEA